VSRSLRSRILVGAILWTVGLFGATVMVTTAVILHRPHDAIVLHWSAMYHGGIVLGAVVSLCILAGIAYVRSGLSPIDQLRGRLSSVRDGSDRRVQGRYPAEVQPLVDDLNALLEHRDQTVRRAIAKAGDLAHALKTPLAVLAHEAEVADTAGHGELAAVMRQQIARMRRQTDYHLAHARAAASGATSGAHCAVLASAEGLARTLLRLHAERELSIQVDVPPGHVVRVEREDLDEMLGNLLDNACKWGRSRIAVASAAESEAIVITVDDDGPGLEESMRDAVLQRGVRADEAAPGSGLGLAIVRDLAELYGGSIVLSRSPAGGLRARLQLPGRAPGR
jgi:signal transduction histidine kinase